MYNILICDDEQDIVNALKIYLSGGDYCLFEASNGREALEVVEKNDIHLILMDIMMPQLDGIAATAKLREKSNVPIILLTAKSESSDKVLGLNIGADDYIIKPFEPKEVVARVKAVLRRFDNQQARVASAAKDEPKDVVTYDGLVISLANYSVTDHENPIDIPPIDLELLYFLASHPNQVFTREQLLDQIWGYEYIGETRTVDVHIKRIREKLTENPAWSLTTVWGIGYKFEVNA